MYVFHARGIGVLLFHRVFRIDRNKTAPAGNRFFRFFKAEPISVFISQSNSQTARRKNAGDVKPENLRNIHRPDALLHGIVQTARFSVRSVYRKVLAEDQKPVPPGGRRH